jgi:hypothetical protein
MTNQQNTSKVLNIAVWICQILLAITLVWAVAMKWLKPIDELAQMWPWVAENPTLTRITGIFDLAGWLGLVLPAALRIKPVLTIYAAYGIIALMLAASVFHISRGEASQIGFNVFVAIMAGFIGWARRKG